MQEVKVRFAGFDYSHDEWVNLKAGVRDRSIPLEASECHKVSVGDLVLCYRVRYDHDDAQEKVGLDWICCRPGSRASSSSGSSGSSSRQQVRLPPKSIFY
ncbi:Protein SAWADEE HOMEODOMAIN HOMOLOG 1 [Linum grandiflorum]